MIIYQYKIKGSDDAETHWMTTEKEGYDFFSKRPEVYEMRMLSTMEPLNLAIDLLKDIAGQKHEGDPTYERILQTLIDIGMPPKKGTRNPFKSIDLPAILKHQAD